MFGTSSRARTAGSRVPADVRRTSRALTNMLDTAPVSSGCGTYHAPVKTAYQRCPGRVTWRHTGNAPNDG